jgi:N-acetylglutamate synthase-like GNAT family acetyltransferase
MVTIRKSAARVAEFERVVWEVFFQSKNRGISLLRHFPWISNRDESAYYMVAELAGQVVGGLAVREWVGGSIHSHKVKTGLIGLVCIAPIFRGRGIASTLVDATLKQAADDGFDALTLWTGKPDLYRQHGFVEADNWTYGWARLTHIRQSKALLMNCSAKLVERPSAPIPPFALSTHELIGAQSSVFLVKDAAGCIVTGYTGDVKEAASLMRAILPENWRVNLEKGNILRDELKDLGYCLDVRPVNLQMWFCINSNYSVAQLVEKLRIPVLDRI